MPIPRDEGFEKFLGELRNNISEEYPHLIDLFDVFADEARFGRKWLNSALLALDGTSKLLEVGGGLMLLSSELQREGFNVTVVEPIGEGFSSFTELQRVVIEFSQLRGHAPLVLSLPVEELSSEAEFDLAFSVNVMEHVGCVSKALINIYEALKPGGVYRFTCPNYVFPYEPHFNIPTLFSKRLTKYLFKNKIENSVLVADSLGMWASLNWISVPMISRQMKSVPGAIVHFNRSILGDSLERVVFDAKFASRRSKWVRVFSRWIVANRLHHLFLYLPATVFPIIDCYILRSKIEPT